MLQTLVRTAKYEIPEMISDQMPMSAALCGMGRRYFDRNFHASKRNSMMLLIRAKRGASLKSMKVEFTIGAHTEFTYGKAVTNRVTKPN